MPSFLHTPRAHRAASSRAFAAAIFTACVIARTTACALTGVSLLASASAHTQAPPQPSPVIVVTGSREPLPPERVAADVVLIDAETIRASSADSVADLLRREAGVQLSRSGGPGQATGVFLRGAAAVNTVVLIDGVRIGSATLGSAALEGLSLAQVERIEVLRGPGSSLYGADAVGGVVQIFTRRGAAGVPGSEVRAEAGVGGYGARTLAVGTSGALGAWDWSASLSHEADDGVSALRPGDAFGNHNPDRDGHRLDSLQLSAGLTPAAGHRIGLSLLQGRLNAQYDASEFLPPSFAQDNTPDFRNRLRTRSLGADWQGRLRPGLRASVRVGDSSDDLESGGRQVDAFETHRRQVGAQLAWDSGAAGTLIAALERVVEKVQSSSYAGAAERDNDALVLALQGAERGDGGWAWQAEARRDERSDFGGVNTARLGGSRALAPGWRLRALVGSTFRAPSFNDLVFPGYGVPSLQPERGRSAEVGLQWRQAQAHAEATLWRNRVRDLIGYESDRRFCPPGFAYDFGCARNLARARLQGLSLSVGSSTGAWTWKATADFLDARDEATRQRLPRRAAHQAHLSASHTAGAWTASAALLRLGARVDGGRSLAAETTLDLGLRWRLAPAWTLQARVLNATDRDLQPVRDYQGLGRQAWLQLGYEI